MNEEASGINNTAVDAPVEGQSDNVAEKPKTRQMLTLENGQSHTADRWVFLTKKNKWVGLSVAGPNTIEVLVIQTGLVSIFLAFVSDPIFVEKVSNSLSYPGDDMEDELESMFEKFLNLYASSALNPAQFINRSEEEEALPPEDEATVIPPTPDVIGDPDLATAPVEAMGHQTDDVIETDESVTVNSGHPFVNDDVDEVDDDGFLDVDGADEVDEVDDEVDEEETADDSYRELERTIPHATYVDPDVARQKQEDLEDEEKIKKEKQRKLEEEERLLNQNLKEELEEERQLELEKEQTLEPEKEQEQTLQKSVQNRSIGIGRER